MSEKTTENTEKTEKALTPAEVYSRRARSAADAMIADPIAAGKILAQLAASDGRGVARKAIRAAWLADPEVSAARKAFRGR